MLEVPGPWAPVSHQAADPSTSLTNLHVGYSCSFQYVFLVSVFWVRTFGESILWVSTPETLNEEIVTLPADTRSALSPCQRPRLLPVLPLHEHHVSYPLCAAEPTDPSQPEPL